MIITDITPKDDYTLLVKTEGCTTGIFDWFQSG